MNIPTDRTVTLATAEQIPQIMDVVAGAKQIMRNSGNMNQWVGNYPSADVISHDIENGNGYVILNNGSVVAYFAFIPSPEPTYARIYEGEWLDDVLPYYVIHRIASTPSSHGIFKDIIDFGFSQCTNIRIDTYRDNQIMRHNLAKHGFTYCGIIYLTNGDERLAFQKLAPTHNKG